MRTTPNIPITYHPSADEWRRIINWGLTTRSTNRAWGGRMYLIAGPVKGPPQPRPKGYNWREDWERKKAEFWL